MNQFERRIRDIFKDFEVFMYKECPEGFSGPFVEFDLRPLERSHAAACADVPLKLLNRLAKLLGTEDITVTGFDMMDPPCCCKRDELPQVCDYVAYVIAQPIKFPKQKRSRK
jgi:hypothetical protein